jgi:hypothetical protein
VISLPKKNKIRLELQQINQLRHYSPLGLPNTTSAPATGNAWYPPPVAQWVNSYQSNIINPSCVSDALPVSSAKWDIIYRVNEVYHRKMEVLMGTP